MRWLFIAAVLLAGASGAGYVRGQDRQAAPGSRTRYLPDQPRPAPSTPFTMTPEMWFYERAQEQYNDPGQVVRRRAEFQAQQRLLRLESRKWFGLSNLRPTVAPDPYHTSYSPTWVGNGWAPNYWVGTAPGFTIIRTTPPDAGRVQGLW